MTNTKDDGPEKGEKPNDKPKDRRVVVEFDRAERAAAAATSSEEDAMDTNASTPERGGRQAGEPVVDPGLPIPRLPICWNKLGV